KPIMAILHQQSTAANVITKSKAGLVLTFNGENDVKKISQNFISFIKTFLDFKKSYLPGNIDQQEFEKYSAYNITKQLASLLEKEKNSGLYETLNKMIKSSNGNLIKLWSQDDIMQPDCLGATVAFHEKYPDISFSYSDRMYIDRSGKIIAETTLKNDSTPEYI